ncbi:MAG: GNAT family N-acetyltransferase, partial [Chlamydiae bacterium]|nr:GNAT family N-acetyltransferase [Chlamydiota bacterium]
TELQDEPFLRKWVQESLSWFSIETGKELEEQLKIWMGYARFKCSLTATYEGKPCGVATLFLFPYVKLLHQSMGYIVVDPGSRRQGVGRALVRNLDHLAESYFRLERMHYEVYGENPLRKLLIEQGYKELFEQKHFVKEGELYLSRFVLEKKYNPLPRRV